MSATEAEVADDLKDLKERVNRVEGYMTAPDGVLPQLASIRSLLEAHKESREREAATIAALDSGDNRAVRLSDCRRTHDSASSWVRMLVPPFVAAGLAVAVSLLLR